MFKTKKPPSKAETMIHTVKMQFTYTATVRVEADTREAAQATALRYFACFDPMYTDGLSDKIQGWDAPVVPEKRILKD